jgi:hypothetical protein
VIGAGKALLISIHCYARRRNLTEEAPLIEEAPQVGLEPTTLRLTVAGTGLPPITGSSWDIRQSWV